MEYAELLPYAVHYTRPSTRARWTCWHVIAMAPSIDLGVESLPALVQMEVDGAVEERATQVVLLNASAVATWATLEYPPDGQISWLDGEGGSGGCDAAWIGNLTSSNSRRRSRKKRLLRQSPRGQQEARRPLELALQDEGPNTTPLPQEWPM